MYIVIFFLLFFFSTAQAETTISDGLTLTIPEQGDLNWAPTVQTAVTAISGHDHTGSPSGVQIQNGAIANNAVDGGKIRLANGCGASEGIKARNNANSADIELLCLNSSDEAEFAGDVTFTGAVSYNNLTITGGAISGITDLGVADGGTGASTQSGARTNLGLGAVAVDNVVPVSRGGTNATTASGARASLSCAELGANSDLTSIDSIGNSTIRAGDGVTVTSTYLWLKADNSEKVAIGGTDSGGTNYPWTFGNAAGEYLVPPAAARVTHATSMTGFSTDRDLGTAADLAEVRNVLQTLKNDLDNMGILD